MTHPWGSIIQVQEKAKRRRNAARGRKCDKGTIPQVRNLVKESAPKKESWFDRLRSRIKALWGKATGKKS